MVTAISLLICLAASALGAICGIGGGVIIKPVLDSLGIYSVSTVNFLSGCTVLSMSGYTVLKGLRDTDSSVDWGRTSFLAVGAALGGLLGKELFSQMSELFAASETVGAIQAVCLFIITLGTLLYTLNKQRIPTRNLHGRMVCILIGFFLGASSSFLGIGGGPINLVVLFYFFSMDTKTAAQNSLYIILISQISSLLLTVLSGSVPPFSLPTLLGMAVCGVLGGIAGRCVNRRIPSATVDRLFIGMMGLILAICVYNYLRFT